MSRISPPLAAAMIAMLIAAVSLTAIGQSPGYKISIVATGGAQYVVVDPRGREVSKHSTQHAAEAVAIAGSLNDGGQTYFVRQSLELRVSATGPVAPPRPPVDPPVEPEPPVDPPVGVFDPAKLQFVGGYRIPAAMDTQGRSMAFSHCGITGLGDTIWMTHHAGSGAIIELARPNNRGTNLSNQNSWPIATAGRSVWAYREIQEGFGYGNQVMGCHWSPELDRLLVSGRDVYATGPQPQRWLVSVQWGDKIKVEPAIAVGGLNAARFGGGFCAIPKWFADKCCGGNTIGIGLGGYESGQNSAHSPCLAAYGDAPLKVLMQSNFGAPKENREQRDANYDSTGLGGTWQANPDGNIGYWTSDEVLGTAWVDTPEVSSFVALVIQPVGTLDYNLQIETFSRQVQYRLYVYDPADLAKVAQGQLAANRVRGKWYPVPSIGAGNPRGVWWDSEANRLNIVYQNAWSIGGTESYPIVAEYEVVQ